nr:MAG TPA: hypothetical protein [Caudoviricetes sp.]
MATPAQTQRSIVPLLRPQERSPARNGGIAKSNHTGKTNSLNKGRLKQQAAFPTSKHPKTNGRQPRSITDGVSAFQSYQPTQKHLPRLKTQLRRRKRHIPKTGIPTAAREKNLYAREKSSGYRGYHKTLHLQPYEYK